LKDKKIYRTYIIPLAVCFQFGCTVKNGVRAPKSLNLDVGDAGSFVANGAEMTARGGKTARAVFQVFSSFPVRKVCDLPLNGFSLASSSVAKLPKEDFSVIA